VKFSAHGLVKNKAKKMLLRKTVSWKCSFGQEVQPGFGRPLGIEHGKYNFSAQLFAEIHRR
jgi:hypothetical protein